MAKKTTNVGTPLGYGFLVEDGPQGVYDNRHKGVPTNTDFALDGTRFPKGKMSFVNNVALGECVDRPDVIVQTADGTSRSEGQNKGQQGNYSPSSAWSEDKPWKGNLTGM